MHKILYFNSNNQKILYVYAWLSSLAHIHHYQWKKKKEVNHMPSVIPEHQGGSLGEVSHFIDFNSINTLWLAAWQALPG